MRIITAGCRCSVSDLSTTVYYPYDYLVGLLSYARMVLLFQTDVIYIPIYLHAPSASRGYLGIRSTYAVQLAVIRSFAIKLSSSVLSLFPSISKAATSQFASIVKSKDPEKKTF